MQNFLLKIYLLISVAYKRHYSLCPPTMKKNTQFLGNLFHKMDKMVD
jgi:hypothetical protein